jgi:hypothetical protein
MNEKRVSLFERLPEIYKTKDASVEPPNQLRSYLQLIEDAFGAIRENIESLYHDLFIETCDAWVIPYIGDLLGTTHLSGDAWTLRADVAGTIALRRLKGTLRAIELLTYNLTGWGVHCVELRENMVWNHHLNHQRPDEGGQLPYGVPGVTGQTVVRGGTVTLRDPAMLSLLATPFDPFAHTADLKPPVNGDRLRYNLPNLAIFLWRLTAYRIRVSRPLTAGVIDATANPAGADFIVRFNLNPSPVNDLSRPYVVPGNEPEGQPLRLFNTHRFNLFNSTEGNTDTNHLAPSITRVDETPAPILRERLTESSLAGRPSEYVAVETYEKVNDPQDEDNLRNLNITDTGLQLHLPDPPFASAIWPAPEGQASSWKIRGANLCAWEAGLQPPLETDEIAIDPVIGRMVMGVSTSAKATALADDLLLTYTYGATGPVGAHPISRASLPEELSVPPQDVRKVNFHKNPYALRDALNDLHLSIAPVVIEITDSMTHDLDLDDVALVEETIAEDGGTNLLLNSSLVIRAADEQRPIIRLRQSLRFRPLNVVGATPQEQEKFDGVMSKMTVRLEGIYLARDEYFPAGEPLIARAAVNRLELINCTLDPGGFRKFDGTRAPVLPAMRLSEPYGFADAGEETAFDQTPDIVLSRTIAGPLFIDTGYRLFLTDSIVDAGRGVGDVVDDSPSMFAVTGANNPDPLKTWGPPTLASGLTVFGRMRVESIEGRGGIWVHALEVLNNQKGCLKFSYFSGEAVERLPQNQGCVKGAGAGGNREARLRFTSEIFGDAAYGQLAMSADFRIRERGPNDDAMGAFGFLLEAHKWRNLQIRYREFMPVGITPLLIPIT